MSRRLQFDPLATYDADTILTGAGFTLGQRVPTSQGIYVLSECSADLAKGQILVDDITLFTTDNITHAADSGTWGTQGYIHATLTDINNTVIAANRLAGLILHCDDDGSDIGSAVYIRGNTVGTASANTVITLERDIATPTGELDVTVFDPNYVEKAAVTVKTQRIIGVAPTTVDQSDKPYFWRQVSGIAPVLMGATGITVGRMVIPGAGTAGQAVEHTTTASDDALPFGTLISDAPAAAKLGIVYLHGVLS